MAALPLLNRKAAWVSGSSPMEEMSSCEAVDEATDIGDISEIASNVGTGRARNARPFAKQTGVAADYEGLKRDMETMSSRVISLEKHMGLSVLLR